LRLERGVVDIMKPVDISRRHTYLISLGLPSQFNRKAIFPLAFVSLR